METTTSKTVVVNGVHGKKIKSVVLTSTGGGHDYSNLQVKEEDYPKMDKDDQVIVRVKATGLNFAELMQRQGLYKPSTKTPYTPGYEASGVVEELGPSVTDLKVNDRVVVFNSSGMWKEVVCLPRFNVVKIPDNMSFEDAAGILVNYVTAYQILFRMANLRPGDTVLVHMAGGGVGTAATQLCRTIPGVTVIGTASSSKHDAIRENGVHHAIDYTTSDYVQEVRKICPNGVDIVLDPLNGDNSIKGYELLRPFGRIVHYGAASMTTESRSLVNAFKAWWKCLSINSLDIVSENKSVSGYHLGYLLNNPVVAKEMLNDINLLLEMYHKGQIKIKIDSTYSFSKIGEAMKRMHSRQNIGKIIVKPDAEFEGVSAPDQVKIVTTVISTSTTTALPDKVVLETTAPVETTQIVPGAQVESEEATTSKTEPAEAHVNQDNEQELGSDKEKLITNEQQNEQATA